MKIKRDFTCDPNLALYLPLYQLGGPSFMSKDAYGHLCTVTGALWTPQGRYFDGTDDYIDCGNNSALFPTDAITVEAWLYVPTFTGYSQAISSRGNVNPNSGFQLEVGSGSYWNPDAYISGGWRSSGAQTPIFDSWVHYVFTYDGATLANYLNLTLKSAARTGAITQSSEKLAIGRDGAQSFQYFKGYIGEVRIYNRALSLLEVQQNYLATKWRYR